MSTLVQKKKLYDGSRRILDALTADEAAVLRFSFGIDADAESDAEIAGRLKIHPEAVNIHRSRALRKLRHPSHAVGLKSLLESDSASPPRPEIFVSKAIEEIEALTPELLDRLRSRTKEIEKLKPDVFEHLVGELLASRGFCSVALVGRNQATSADLVATRYVDDVGEHKYFIEIKRWKDKVGVEVIDRVHGAVMGEKSRWGWTAAMVVSIVGFKNFKKYTRQDVANLGIYLKDRDDLLGWLSEYEVSPTGLWLPPEVVSHGAAG